MKPIPNGRWLCLVFFAGFEIALADPVSVSVSPPFQVAFTGTITTVQISVSGMIGNSAPSLGAFQATLNYDPNVLVVLTVTFGHPVLGDQLNLAGFGSGTFTDTTLPGSLTLGEVSFDTVQSLNSGQQDSFVLATITFGVIAEGTVPLSLSDITLGDALGNRIPLSPGNVVGGSLDAVPPIGVPGQTCATSANRQTVRSEGTVEALGAIILSCGPAITGVPVTISVFVQLPAGAVIPGSSTPDNISTFPLPQITTNLPVPNTPVADGVVVGNTITFSFTPIAAAQTFVISKIRANIVAAGLAGGSSINALLFSSQNPSFTFSNFALVLATAVRGLATRTGFRPSPLYIPTCAAPVPISATSGVLFSPGSSGSVNFLNVTSDEGFANAWRTAAQEDGGLGGLQGTRLLVSLTSIPKGVKVFAPAKVSGTANSITLDRVANPNTDGSGGMLTNGVAGTYDNILIVSGTATILYEVTAMSGVTSLKSVEFAVVLVATEKPEVGAIRGIIALAPIGPPTASPARPQFAAGLTRVIARIVPCDSYLLYPWVINTGDGMLDTAITVSNTTADPPDIGTADEVGNVTLHFWSSDGGTQPSPVTISPARGLLAGQTATFLLSQLGVPFQGYVIAVCEFRLGHGAALIASPRTGSISLQMALSLTNPRLPLPDEPSENTLH